MLIFSKTISKVVDKSTRKFIIDMQYGIAKSESCLISEISRSLKEKIELKNTIGRLCDNLNNITNYELVFVYWLSEDKPIILLTNGGKKSKEDLIKAVNLYFYDGEEKKVIINK